MFTILLFAENLTCGMIIAAIIGALFLMNSEFGRTVLLILLGLAATFLIGLFLFETATPVVYWLAVSLVLLAGIQFIKSRLYEADNGESFKSRFGKGCRDAVACITIGLGIVTLAQVVLRSLGWIASDAFVEGTEDFLLAVRTALKSLLDIKILFWTFAILVPISVAAPNLEILSRYSQFRNWAERVFLILLTVTAFTFFGSEGVHGYRATLTQKRSKEALEALDRFDESKRQLAAAVIWEKEIRDAGSVVRLDLKKLVDPPSAAAPVGPRPGSDPDGAGPTKKEGPTKWNPLIISSPKDEATASSDRAKSETNPTTPAEYAEFIAKPLTETIVPAQEKRAEERVGNSLDKAVETLSIVAEKREPRDLTIGEIADAKLVVLKQAEIYAEQTAGVIEVVKNLIEEGVGMNDSSIFKPFVKALIDAVAETLVKTTIPNFVNGVDQVREWWSQRSKAKAVNQQLGLGWKDRLSRLFVSAEQLAKEEQERKRGRDELLKMADKHLAKMEANDRWEQVRIRFKTALMNNPESLGDFSDDQEKIFRGVLDQWEAFKAQEKLKWYQNADTDLEDKFFEFSHRNPRVKACFGFMIQQKDFDGAVAYYTRTRSDPGATGKPYYMLKYYYNSTGHGRDFDGLYDADTNYEVGTVCPH